MTAPRRELAVELKMMLRDTLQLGKERGHEGIDPVEFLVVALRKNLNVLQPLKNAWDGSRSNLTNTSLADALLPLGPLVVPHSLPVFVETYVMQSRVHTAVSTPELLVSMISDPRSPVYQALSHELNLDMAEIARQANMEWRPKVYDIDQFARDGYLQEVNRLFFHPRGLAMALEFDNGRYVGVVTIHDAREDPEGFLFADNELSAQKQVIPAGDYDAHLAYRREELGTEDGIQPIP